MRIIKTVSVLSFVAFGISTSLSATAQVDVVKPVQTFEKSSVLGLKRNDLYVFCQDSARKTSGYLGYVPGEYSGPNLLEESMNRSRQGGLYDIPLAGFAKQPRQAGTIGGKVIFSFGSKKSKKTGKNKRQKRRDFRKNLDGCLLSKS